MTGERVGETEGREDSGLPYWVWFSLSMVLALATMLAIVFAVFPQRFVLAPGLREGDLDFPVEAPEFRALTPSELRRLPAAVAPPRGAPRPGPRQRLWEDVRPLLEEGLYGTSLPVFHRYLDARPGDTGVRLEYARALERAGNWVQARREYRTVVGATGDPAARRDLARVQWRLGREDAALEILGELARDRPEDPQLALQRAELLTAAGRHGEAAEVYARLLARRPGEAELVLRRARALYQAGDWAGAWRLARSVPDDAPPHAAASRLASRIRSEHPIPHRIAVAGTPLARAREAAAAGDLDRAEALYRSAVFLRPREETARLELADLLALRRQDARGAAAVLAAVADRPGADPSPALRRRLARYRAWSGDLEQARRILAELARSGQATPGDLALLGDVLRWQGEWAEAGERYEAALARAPGQAGALSGLASLRRARRDRVQRRDPERAGVLGDVYVDSDDFRSWSVRGVGALGPRSAGLHTQRVEVEAGVQSLRGPARSGGQEEAVGPMGMVRWIGWWREATLRTSLGVGVEELGPTGVEPRIRAELEIPGAGFALGYRHGLAHPTTLTFATVQDQTRLDGAWASLSRSWADGDWSVWGRVEGASVRDPAVDNGRFVAQAQIERGFGRENLFRAGVVSRLLTTTDPAPPLGSVGSTYWSPELSWSPGLALRLGRRSPADGWSWHARLQPGLSLVRLHDAPDADLEFRFSGDAGIEYRSGSWTIRASTGYLRSRVDGYEAASATFQLFRRF